MRRFCAEIEPCFVEKDGRRTDIVVLACTHYPFMANVFRRLAPWPVDWLDPAEAIARQARRLVPLPEGFEPLNGVDPRDLHIRQSGFRHTPADAGFRAERSGKGGCSTLHGSLRDRLALTVGSASEMGAMATGEDLRRMALALEGTVEAPHFDRMAFKVARIYATLAADCRTANFNFTPDEQQFKCMMLPDAFSPVPNAWGRQGWTTADLSRLGDGGSRDALRMASDACPAQEACAAMTVQTASAA